MSQQLISRSEDLKQLRDEGYNIEVRTDSGHILIKDVPYVTADRVVKTDGVLVSQLSLAGDVTTTPDDHVVRFAGETPCDQHGQPLSKIIAGSSHEVLAPGLEIDHTFSSKPPAGMPGYANYHEKMTAYVNILLGPAHAIDPSVNPRTFPVLVDDDEQSVFRYVDSASSRARIGAVTQKLELAQVAIVGLGGTGSYVLDLVAKTPVREIHLFDGDEFLNHNAFRSPGAPPIDALRAKPLKVDYFGALYSNMRDGIIAHAAYVDASNVELLHGMDFVFLSLDAGEGKRLAIQHLEEAGVPFVDVGMGIYQTRDAIGGIVRTTTSTPDNREAATRHVSLADADDDEYAQNIQIADLNALNAALAVIRWKKHFGFYLDFEHEHHSTYTIDGNQLLNEDRLDAN
jgi:ThiF family